MLGDGPPGRALGLAQASCVRAASRGPRPAAVPPPPMPSDAQNAGLPAIAWRFVIE